MVDDTQMIEEPIVTMLMRAIYWFDDALEQGFEAHGLPAHSRAEAFVILNIAMGERRAINIAKNLGVSRQATSQILNGLEARGFLKIKPDPTNGRARIAAFASGYEKKADACRQILAGAEATLADRIGKKLALDLRRALESNWGLPPRHTGTKQARKVKRRSSQATVA